MAGGGLGAGGRELFSFCFKSKPLKDSKPRHVEGQGPMSLFVFANR